MMQIVVVVMAIALASLLVAGGASYLSADVGTRISVAQGLMTQHEALAAGIATYRSANNGMLPTHVDRIRPYLVGGAVPRSPKGAEGLSWSMARVGGKRLLCLSHSGAPLDGAVADAVANFARDAAARAPAGAVAMGGACGSGGTDPDTFSSAARAQGDVAVTFGNY